MIQLIGRSIRTIFAKLLKFFLVILGGFRRALCCWRRKNNDKDSLPFRIDPSTIHVENVRPMIPFPTNHHESAEFQNWQDCQFSDWGEANNCLPNNFVRDSSSQLSKSRNFHGIPDVVEETEVEPNYFEDMVPSMKGQKKVLIKPAEEISNHMMNRLSFDVQHPALQTADLGVLDEFADVGTWEDSVINDVGSTDTQSTLKEGRMAERQKRMAEQLKKKSEKDKSRKTHFKATKVS